MESINTNDYTEPQVPRKNCSTTAPWLGLDSRLVGTRGPVACPDARWRGRSCCYFCSLAHPRSPAGDTASDCSVCVAWVVRDKTNVVNPMINHPKITVNGWYKPSPNGRFWQWVSHIIWKYKQNTWCQQPSHRPQLQVDTHHSHERICLGRSHSTGKINGKIHGMQIVSYCNSLESNFV